MKIQVDGVDKVLTFLGVLSVWLITVHTVSADMTVYIGVLPTYFWKMFSFMVLVFLGTYTTIKWIVSVDVKFKYLLLYLLGSGLVLVSVGILKKLLSGSFF